MPGLYHEYETTLILLLLLVSASCQVSDTYRVQEIAFLKRLPQTNAAMLNTVAMLDGRGYTGKLQMKYHML